MIESHHAPDFEMEMGRWPFHKICWVAMGRGQLRSEGRASPIQRDDFLLLPASWAHQFIDDSREPLTLIVFCVSESFFSAAHRRQLGQLWRVAQEGIKVGTPVCARSGFHRSEMVECFRSAMRESEAREAGWQAAIAAAATNLLVYLNREYCRPREAHARDSRQTVGGSIEYIESHLQEVLQIEDIAGRCHLSPRRYTDLFKEITGSTFSQFVRRKRIEYACRRLDETGHIVYACHESGFNDVAYFYRVFKNELGMTPGQYLESVARGERCSGKTLRG
jgi:AraC-like DNA-binding protein